MRDFWLAALVAMSLPQAGGASVGGSAGPGSCTLWGVSGKKDVKIPIPRDETGTTIDKQKQNSYWCDDASLRVKAEFADSKGKWAFLITGKPGVGLSVSMSPLSKDDRGMFQISGIKADETGCALLPALNKTSITVRGTDGKLATLRLDCGGS